MAMFDLINWCMGLFCVVCKKKNIILKTSRWTKWIALEGNDRWTLKKKASTNFFWFIFFSKINLQIIKYLTLNIFLHWKEKHGNQTTGHFDNCIHYNCSQDSCVSVIAHTQSWIDWQLLAVTLRSRHLNMWQLGTFWQLCTLTFKHRNNKYW